MPIYEYRCETCGAELEILHGIGKTPQTCGLHCRRRDAGAFGQGTLVRKITAARINTGNAVLKDPLAARRDPQGLSEKDIDRARTKGMTVYRRDSSGGYFKDGGDAKLPKTLMKGGD